MPRRGENIYKRKDGRWEGRYIQAYINGKAKYGYVYAKSYKEVKIRLQETKKECYVVKYPEKKLLSSKEDISFGSIAEEWLSFRRLHLKQSSIVKYKNILNLYLFPVYKDVAIASISRSMIEEYINNLLLYGGRNQKGLSPKTVLGIISVIKSIFQYASCIKNQNVTDISHISIKQISKPMRIFSITEQQRITEYLIENLTECNLGILICMYTGMRIGEICAMKWDCVDFDDRMLFVNNTMQRLQTENNPKRKTEVIISKPKSNCSIRRIPIPDYIFKFILQNKTSENSFILTGKSDKFIEPRTLENIFNAILEKYNIKDATFHTIRHTFATRCVELGFDLKSLSEILGHASVNITLNKYVHPSMESKKRNMEMLSDLFNVK